jgi:Fe-S cluster assembly protein SufB
VPSSFNLLRSVNIGEFFSVAVTNNYQQADTGTKMIHLGKNTSSTIISKGIAAGQSQQILIPNRF